MLTEEEVSAKLQCKSLQLGHLWIHFAVVVLFIVHIFIHWQRKSKSIYWHLNINWKATRHCGQ